MPKGNVDYSKGLIYKLCCKDPNIKEIYVGSTVNFRGRKGNHKAGCNNPIHRDFNTKKSKFIREHGGWENWEMILVEYYSATDLRDLEQRERYWFDELNSKLNTYIPYTSSEERKEHNRKTTKLYHENNKEKDKLYRINNKEKIKEHKKEYYIKKKNYIDERNRKYNEKNKEKLKEKYKEYYERTKIKMTCDCGIELFKKNYKNHCKSKKHIEWFNNNS